MTETSKTVRCLACYETYNILWNSLQRKLPRCVVRLGPAKKCGGELEFAVQNVRVPKSREVVPLADQEDMADLDRFLSQPGELEGDNDVRP